jgi:hypothetical protein
MLELAQLAQAARPTVIWAAMCGAALMHGEKFAERNAPLEAGGEVDGDDGE